MRLSNIERDEELRKEKVESLQRFNDFKERMKLQAMRHRGANNASQGSASHQKLGGGAISSEMVAAGYSEDPLDDDLTSESEDEQFDENGRPMYDLQSQQKLEFKKYLRLQKEGLVNLSEIFKKM